MRPLLYLLISTVILGAQAPAPGDTAAYSVAYVDVMPASRAAAVSALKQYREASRNDEGLVRIEFLEQVGRPSHFNVIETWANPKALETHAAAAHTKQMQSKFDLIRTSAYDQRSYKPIATMNSPTNDRGIYVVAHVDIGGQGTNAPDVLRRLAEASRKDEGNLRFDILQHAMRANHFTIIEAWKDQKALDAHAAATHTKQYRDGLAPITGSPIDERTYKVVE